MAELKEGMMAPAISLPDENGKVIELKDFKGKWVILYFYPKDMTSGCTTESCEFSDTLPRFKSKKAVILGVSKDSVASHKKFKDKYDFGFSLLADEEIKVCKAYGVYKKKSLYGREYMGIERTTFIIDPKGKIAKLYPKVKVAGHVSKVLEDLKGLAD